MKAIDFTMLDDTAVRIFLGRDDLRHWWGDDWGDAPYECNAGTVYEEFVAGSVDIRFPRDAVVLEPCDGHLNSPWCKDDMRDGTVPMLAVLSHVPDGVERWEVSGDFTRLMGRRACGVWVCHMGSRFDKDALPDGAVIEDWFVKEGDAYVEDNREMVLIHLTHTPRMGDDRIDYMDRLASALFWVKDASELADRDDGTKVPGILTGRIIELACKDGNEGAIERLRRIGDCKPEDYVGRLGDALGCGCDAEAVTERLVGLLGG